MLGGGAVLGGPWGGVVAEKPRQIGHDGAVNLDQQILTFAHQALALDQLLGLRFDQAVHLVGQGLDHHGKRCVERFVDAAQDHSLGWRTGADSRCSVGLDQLKSRHHNPIS